MTVPAQTWKAGVGRSLVAEETGPDDLFVKLWIADPVDGPTARLTAMQAREIAADLMRRADLMQGVIDLSHIALDPINRPNGKVYKPKRIAVERWEDDWEGRYGVVILGTHDIDAVRALADQAVKWWDNEYIATKPDVDWFRLAYSGNQGEMAWQRDEVRGRAGVLFTADYPEVAR